MLLRRSNCDDTREYSTVCCFAEEEYKEAAALLSHICMALAQRAFRCTASPSMGSLTK